LDIRDVTASIGFLGKSARAGSARGQVTYGNSNADSLLAGDQIWQEFLLKSLTAKLDDRRDSESESSCQ